MRHFVVVAKKNGGDFEPLPALHTGKDAQQAAEKAAQAAVDGGAKQARILPVTFNPGNPLKVFRGKESTVAKVASAIKAAVTPAKGAK